MGKVGRGARWTPGFAIVMTALALTSSSAVARADDAGPQEDSAAKLARITAELLPVRADRSMDIGYLGRADTVFAHLGAGSAKDYEIGSIGKTFTAELFADAVTRGEVRADTRLREVLPLAGSAIGEVTLGDLAEHRSGVPEFATTPEMALGGIDYVVYGKNPFHFDLPQLLAAARATPLLPGGVFQYSTLGYALLGQAVAAAAHTDYLTLLRTRMLEPLGLTHTWTPLTEADLPADVGTGIDRSGKPEAAWAINATAPAGGMRSTVGDLAAYARALLAGTVPGMAALEPMAPGNIAGTAHGYSWGVVSSGGVEYTLHSGGTGGFSGLLLLDRHSGTALVFLRDVFDPTLERAGVEILRRMRDE